eukprot:tig00000882_g5261.t1
MGGSESTQAAVTADSVPPIFDLHCVVAELPETTDVVRHFKSELDRISAFVDKKDHQRLVRLPKKLEHFRLRALEAAGAEASKSPVHLIGGLPTQFSSDAECRKARAPAPRRPAAPPQAALTRGGAGRQAIREEEVPYDIKVPLRNRKRQLEAVFSGLRLRNNMSLQDAVCGAICSRAPHNPPPAPKR